MFDFLKGTLVENNLSYVVIEVQGVGYKLLTAPNTISCAQGSKCTLYTSFVVRENSQQLYGFENVSSRDLFEVLIGISGIGPKTALCILSQFSASSFKEAVLASNTSLIAKVPGLGKKTAEKIVLDLKDKLFKKSFANASFKPSHDHYDAIQALINLGYSERLANQAVEKVIKNSTEELKLPELITEALRLK